MKVYIVNGPLSGEIRDFPFRFDDEDKLIDLSITIFPEYIRKMPGAEPMTDLKMAQETNYKIVKLSEPIKGCLYAAYEVAE